MIKLSPLFFVVVLLVLVVFFGSLVKPHYSYKSRFITQFSKAALLFEKRKGFHQALYSVIYGSTEVKANFFYIAFFSSGCHNMPRIEFLKSASHIKSNLVQFCNACFTHYVENFFLYGGNVVMSHFRVVDHALK